MKNQLILHAIVMHKPKFKTKEQALKYARQHFPKEDPKGFVRETTTSFRVRIIPKTKFKETSYISKPITPDITLIFGHLK